MSLSLVLFLGSFIVLLLLGVPTYLTLITSSLIYFFMHPEISALIVLQKMFTSMDNFVLLAIPLFMLAGNIMNNGGVTDRIFGFARVLVGRWPGGLGHVNTLSSFIFSGMSGSALADVGGLGQIEMKAMKDAGFDDEFTIGITAASATMGPIVPPSIPMVIYGSMANVSVGALFLGGVLPGVVMAIFLTIMIIIYAVTRNYPRDPAASLGEVWKAFKRGFLALLMPAIILGGIWAGFVTPTEASMISILYGMCIILFVYKGMRFRDLLRYVTQTAASIAPMLCIIVAAGMFGWVLQFERIDQKMLNLLLGISQNKVIILLMLNLILLFFGCFLDSTPVIMLMVPIFMPLANAIGIHPVHMGVIIVLNLMIGLMTPPIGNSLFMLATVTGKPFEEIVHSTWKWLIPLFIALMVVTFVPGVVLWLPRLAGLL